MPRSFDTVDDVTDQDAVVVAKSLPALTGNGSEDIHCGGCGSVLAAKLTEQAICNMFKTDDRLILRCTCQADNHVPCEDRAQTQH